MRKPQLDGLRFILFLVVFAIHYTRDPTKLWFLSYALPCFFVMSGFLITRVLLAGERGDLMTMLRVFYLRRFLRIVPSYFLVLGLLAAMGALTHPGYFVTYLVNVKLFAMSLDPDPAVMIAWKAGGWHRESWHLWSLSVEEQFYILWPLALYLTPARLRTAMLLGLVALSIASRVLFMRYLPTSFFGALLPPCMEYFAWGCLFGWWETRKRLAVVPPGPVFMASVGGVGLVVVAQYLFGPWGFLQFVTTHYQTPMAIALGGLIWSLWALPGRHAVVRFLSFRPFAYFGEMSYTCYLVHLLARDLFLATGIDLPFSAYVDGVIGAFVLTLLMAMAIWHLFEKPIYGLRRHLPYDRPKATIAEGPAA